MWLHELQNNNPILNNIYWVLFLRILKSYAYYIYSIFDNLVYFEF